MSRAAVLSLFAAVALLLVTPVRADDAKAAQAPVKAGMRAYDLGKYDEAMVKLEEAYRLQGDPHLLFNMGQVYWKWGKDEDARKMYESYLRNLPEASNRSLVEERLAEIERRKKEQREKEPPAPAAEPAVAAPEPIPPPSPPTPAPAASALPSGPPPVGQAPAAQKEPAAALSQSASEPQPSASPFYKKWWFWTATGGVVVAAVVLGVLAANRHDSPQGSLGTFGPGR